MIYTPTLKSNVMYFPIPFGTDTRTRTMSKVLLNPGCFTHKDYPYCAVCKTKYVPIDNKCFKCVIKGNG